MLINFLYYIQARTFIRYRTLIFFNAKFRPGCLFATALLFETKEYSLPYFLVWSFFSCCCCSHCFPRYRSQGKNPFQNPMRGNIPGPTDVLSYVISLPIFFSILPRLSDDIERKLKLSCGGDRETKTERHQLPK